MLQAGFQVAQRLQLLLRRHLDYLVDSVLHLGLEALHTCHNVVQSLAGGDFFRLRHPFVILFSQLKL